VTERPDNVLFLCTGNIKVFTSLPVQSLDRVKLQERPREIGRRHHGTTHVHCHLHDRL
jgi:hypothetical protein